MKIVFLSDDFPPENYGGAGVVAHDLAKGLKDLGHDVHIITSTQDRDGESEHTQEGLKIYKIYSKYHPRWRAYRSVYNRQTVGKIRMIMLGLKPDLVHVHNIHTHLSYHALRISKRIAPRVILTAHDAMLYSYGKVCDERRADWMEQLVENRFRYNPIRNILIKFYLRYVDRVVAVSDSLARALINNGIKNVTTIHNGISVKDWAASKDSVDLFKREHKLAGKKTILTIGRLNGAKGAGKIVEALALVVEDVPGAVLIVAGREDGYFQTMLELAKINHIEEHLICTGWLTREDTVIVYNAVDVVVTPSIYLDPFVLINLEAMAAKKPVVGTCFGGTPEIVADNETGYIVNPNDVAELAAKIIWLLNNESVAVEMGARGYLRASDIFTIKRQIEEYLIAYVK